MNPLYFDNETNVKAPFYNIYFFERLDSYFITNSDTTAVTIEAKIEQKRAYLYKTEWCHSWEEHGSCR